MNHGMEVDFKHFRNCLKMKPSNFPKEIAKTKRIFDIITKSNVEIISTFKNSIITEVGGKYVPIKDVL